MEAASEYSILQAWKQSPDAAVIVVDMQPDFYPDGALPVTGGDELVALIPELIAGFETIVFTQDSHPVPHISFASSYPSKKPFEILSLEEVQSGLLKSQFSTAEVETYLQKTAGHTQILWPDHCVQGTNGGELDSRLPLAEAHLILRKGTKSLVDSCSAFFENDGSETGLSGFLKSRGVTKLVVCGLAGDYCVLWTAEDAKREGFQVLVSELWTRFVDFPAGSRAAAISEFKKLNSPS